MITRIPTYTHSDIPASSTTIPSATSAEGTGAAAGGTLSAPACFSGKLTPTKQNCVSAGLGNEATDATVPAANSASQLSARVQRRVCLFAAQPPQSEQAHSCEQIKSVVAGVLVTTAVPQLRTSVFFN